MYLAGRWADRQLSRLELVVVVIIFSLVLGVFLQYMLKMLATAERSLLANSAININSALQYRAAQFALSGDFVSILAMQRMNPFTVAGLDPDWLVPETEARVPQQQMLAGMAIMRVPGNYLGELDNPDPANIEGGKWYFDLHNSTLVYRIDNAEYFDTNLPKPPRVVFAVEIDYEDHNTNMLFDPQIDEYRGVRLQPQNQYGWQL